MNTVIGDFLKLTYSHSSRSGLSRLIFVNLYGYDKPIAVTKISPSQEK